MESQVIKDTVKDAVKEAFKEELKNFYIDSQTHYEHHKFIGDWINWTKQCKSTILKTLVGAVVLAVLGLMVFGFVTKYKGP